MPRKKHSPESYKIGWICPLEVEQVVAMEMLDEEHEPLAQSSADHNVYSLGSINGYNVVIAGLYQTGNCSAAVVVTQMRMTFPNLTFGLLVGIGGGVPVETAEGPIRLGHVVVSKPTGEHSGAVQYDQGKAAVGCFQRTGILAPPPATLLHSAQALAVYRARSDDDPVWKNTQRIQTQRRRLRRYGFPGIANDHLYQPSYIHQKAGVPCEEGCHPKQRIARPAEEDDESYVVVHRGTIASGGLVMKDAEQRDRLAQQYNVLCFEMEAAGALADFPCMVIRGISDYCDSHKNDKWHGYAAAAAAAYARQLLFHMPIEVAQVAEHNEQGPGVWATKNIVPYPSNPTFVGRSGIIQELKEVLGHTRQLNGTSQARVSLFGLGGIGKTQIALAYVYWLQQTYPTISIFWVHAIHAERFRQSFATIAEEYQIPGHADPKVDVLVLVKVWLEKNDGRKWLMVIDNADDLHLFFPPPTESTSNSTESGGSGSFSDYLPECAHGALLFTTRNKQLGVKLSRSQCVIEVGRMNEDESEHLLRSKTVNAAPTDLLSLSARLEYLPLALVQAAAYIQEMSITAAEYLVLLGDTDQNMIHLLSKEFETVGRDSKAPRAVANTWILSFQQIEQQQVLASELLSFMSLLDRQDIPAKFLSYYIQRKEHEELASEIKLVEALGVLKAFSFVTENNNGSFDMHRLVHLVTRKWLTGCSRLGRFGKEALLMMSHLYPYGTYETRTTCGLYLPHANAVLQAGKVASKDEAEAKASLLHRMGGYFIFEGKWGDAEAANIEATRIRRELLGHSHPDTLTSMNNLALTFWNQGRWEEAEELQVQVMETHKIKIREDHPDTLKSMNNLALTFMNQGRWDEAEELQVQVMETRKIKLGEDHSDTLKSINNLASIFQNQGRWEEAEELQAQAMETYKIKLGENHLDTLTSMNNLAWTFLKQGRWEEAEELQVQVMKTRKIKLGEDHPDTLRSMGNLALISWNQDQWEEAEELQVQVMKTRKIKLGEDHPDTLRSMGNLALIFWKQDRWEEAEELQVQVMETCKTKLGEDHPNTLMSMNNLAYSWKSMGKKPEAIDLMRRCTRLRQVKLGPHHPYTKSSIFTLDTWENES